MPLPIDITALLAGSLVESERVELKEGWNPESVLHTLCAFANDFHNLGGGYVIVGVAEKDGHAQLPPVGLTPEQIDAIQKEVLNLGHSAIQPFYHPVMEPAVVEGRGTSSSSGLPAARHGPTRHASALEKIRRTGPTSSARGPTPSAPRAPMNENSLASRMTFPSMTA